MKRHLKYFCAAVILLLCGRSSAQKVVSVYNGESEISAPSSVTLTDGFHTMGPVRIFTTGLSYVNCLPFVSAASSSQNYISTKIFKQPGIDPNNLSGRSICEVNETIQYFDGLGRPLQTVQVQGSPGFKDIVQPIAYDAFGREVKKYQPYAAQTGTTGAFRDAAIGDQSSFFLSPTAGVKATAYAFAETQFEASPLNRVQQQGAPGEAWQISNGHTLKTEYGTNIQDEVKLWKINGADNGASAVASVYLPGKLYKTINWDENWIPTDLKAGTTEEFKDFEGRVVLKRIWETNGKSLSTYYVYDDLGNLRYVLPPAVNENGQAALDSFDETQSVFEQFIYGYHYDGRKRLVEKKIPGKGWEFMVYNKLDQVVMNQDAVQRGKSPQEWNFTKYDAFGRVVISGRYIDNLNNGQSGTNYRVSFQNIANGTAAYEKRDASDTQIGYSNDAIPQGSIGDYYVLNYYDDYDFPVNSFGPPTGSQAPKERTKSLLTGTKVKNLGTGTMLLTVNYYDLEGRVVQSKSEHHLNGTDVVDNNWNFDGSLRASTRTHTANSVGTTIANRYEYDHAGRKVATFENINSQGEIALNHLEYNEIGQLTKKNLHNDAQATTFAYNERGWMKNSMSDQFSMKLDYEDGAAQGYNGNITKQYWDWTNTGSPTANIFNYGYDKLNRLGSAATVAGVSMSEALTYDVMGNIASLSRDGAGAKVYNYHNLGNSNRLQSVSGLTVRDYEYDANGNTTKDGLNGFDLTYHYLNLPATAVRTIGTPVSIAYTYDATGNKLSKNSNGTVRNYVDGIEYKPDGTIDIIHTEEGIARNNGGNYNYEYNLSDHLGNIRATFYKNPVNNQLEVLQQDNYYAFGLRKEPVAKAGLNKYLYNGKELQEELGQYDYGARFYDPIIGRWNVIDPLAEKFLSVNPYNYADNNPTNNVDPDGMDVVYGANSTTYTGVDAQSAFSQLKSQYSNQQDDPDDPKKKKKENYASSFYKQLVASDPFSNGSIGATWERWLSSESTLGTDLLNGVSQTMLNIGSLFWSGTYVNTYKNTKAYLAMSSEDRAKSDAIYLNTLIEGAATYAPFGYIATDASVIQATTKTKQFMNFEANAGYGVKVGNFELMYKNPRADGGTILSYKSSAGNKFRLDYHRIPQVGKSLHYHTNFFNLSLGTHRSLSPFNFGKAIKK